MQELTLEQKRVRLVECETEMKSHYYHWRQFEERALEIAVGRLYEAMDFHSFLNYYKSEWQDAEKLSARKYQVLKYATVVANIAENSQQIPLPSNERQTRPLLSLDPEDQAAAWQLAVETNGGERPTGAQVAEAVKTLDPSRLDFIDTDKQPKWIDARPENTSDVTPGTFDPNSKKPEPRYTVDIACDGQRMTFNLVVPMRNRDAQKWYGNISRRQWESVGLCYKGLSQTEFENEDDLRTTEDIPDGVSPDVRAAVAKERARIAAINGHAPETKTEPEPTKVKRAYFAGPNPADAFFADDAQPDPEEQPLPGSFTAGTDFSDLDALAQPFADDYAQ